MRSRVELLPQSKAAIASATNVLEFTYSDASIVRGDEFARRDRSGADEIVGQMSMEALHADASATDSPARLDEVRANRCGPATLGVVVVGSPELARVDQRLKTVDPTLAFETTDGVVQRGIDEPV